MVINRYDQLKRFREVVFVFIRHGFGKLLDSIGILKYLGINRNVIEKHDKGKSDVLSIGQRLRMSLEELGTTFIKLGQVLSTRPDFLPDDIIIELERLQDTVTNFSFEQVREIVESELEGPLKTIFKDFSEEPYAAASISQVHKAVLNSGETVIVKVQRPGIQKKIKLDLRILQDIAWVLDNHTKYGRLYDFKKMVAEFENTLLSEMDFHNEAGNIESFKKNLSSNVHIDAPLIYENLTTKKVITMEYIDGSTLKNIKGYPEEERLKFAGYITESMMVQILKDGFFHADPHPGNILISKDGKIYFLDFGMIGRINERRRATFIKLLMGVVSKKPRWVLDAILEMNVMEKPPSLKSFEKDVNLFFDTYIDIPISQLHIGEIFNEMFKICSGYHIRIPGEFFLVVKSIVTLEGTIEKLAPSISIIEIAKPVVKKLIWEVYSPRNVLEGFLSVSDDYLKFFKNLPSLLLNLTRRIEEEDFTLNMKFQNIDRLMDRLDQISNRISISLVLLALSVVAAGIIIGLGMSPGKGLQEDVFINIFLKVGLMGATILLIWLGISMLRSGKKRNR